MVDVTDCEAGHLPDLLLDDAGGGAGILLYISL
jgi:hypothetical protein